ncbi:putative fha domain protein [Rosellinia necatrix]|uniref:Putative fha domain protein n=1 Tax=Rosellinia necatrix TaxID=77044 RepID=A0A1W2TMG3_ROSNE|nr:putative fha domain protein [Rosellinia necatrix]
MAAATKSPVEAAVCKDEDKIIVTLCPRGPSSIPKRQLVFTRSLPVVLIGRSSKVQSKGFIPADNNAWFDNPVMSRQHAEIIAEFDEKPPSIYINDARSFHGTYHIANDGRNSEKQLIPNKPAKMANGDILRFGINIFRSDKTYPPCSVDCFMEIITHKQDSVPRQGFTVPDDIDDEDEDSNSDENDEDLTITGFYQHIRPNSNLKSTIDLTTDDPGLPIPIAKLPCAATANNNASFGIIDLTSEPDYDSDDEMPTADPVMPQVVGIDVNFPAPPASAICVPDLQSFPELARTADEKIASPPPPTTHADKEDIYVSCRQIFDGDTESEFSYDSLSDIDGSPALPEDMSELTEADDSLGSFQYQLPDTQGPDDDDDVSVHTHFEDTDMSDWEASSCSGDQEVNGEDEDSEVNEDDDVDDRHEDDHHHHEEDDDGEEDEEDDYDEQDGEHHTVAGSSSDPPTTDKPVSLMMLPPPTSYFCPVVAANQRDVAHSRDPSPSDAALFKRRPILNNMTDGNRSQQLGERIGKFEFFAAREKNRVATNHHHSTASISTTHWKQLDIHPDSNNNAKTEGMSHCAVDSAPSSAYIPKTHRSSNAVPIELDGTNMHQFSAWAASGLQFINNPPSDENTLSLPARHQAPEFDMASASKFQLSKQATAVDTNSQTRRLPIQDLLAQESKPKKRSHDEAFDAIDDDITSENAACIIETEHQNPTSKNVVDSPTEQGDLATEGAADVKKETLHQPTAISVRSGAPRPAKRIRVARVAAQVVACVALGGAATFSYLVNTAPVF